MKLLDHGYDTYAPFFSVEKDGKKLPVEHVTGVDIEESIDSPSTLTVNVNESIDSDTQKFDLLDITQLTPGAKINASFGYATVSNRETFEGSLTRFSFSFQAGNQALSLTCYDASFDMLKTQKEENESFTEMKYSDVVSKLASKHKLKTGQIDTTDEVFQKIERDNNESDFDLIKKFADQVGYEFFVNRGALYFREVQDGKKGEIDLEYRKNFLTFNPSLSVANLVNEVEVTGNNDIDNEAITEKVTNKDLATSVGYPDFDGLIKKVRGETVTHKVVGQDIRTSTQAKTRALSELRKKNENFITGTVDCVGDPSLTVGVTINIDKVGPMFSGVYYVTKAKHTLGPTGYKTTLTVRRSVF